mmetsp:Transcript_30850/g.80869  ORF Transcript_30850/g.80869 Transcript_30850/m.80869 type:complete len:295 (-) Transcript_30850:101-985(-)
MSLPHLIPPPSCHQHSNTKTKHPRTSPGPSPLLSFTSLTRTHTPSNVFCFFLYLYLSRSSRSRRARLPPPSSSSPVQLGCLRLLSLLLLSGLRRLGKELAAHLEAIGEGERALLAGLRLHAVERTVVDRAVDKSELSLRVDAVGELTAKEDALRLATVHATAVLLAVLPLALVVVAVHVCVGALAVSEVTLPVALIGGSVGVGELSLSALLVLLVATHVRGVAVGESVGATALAEAGLHRALVCIAIRVRGKPLADRQVHIISLSLPAGVHSLRGFSFFCHVFPFYFFFSLLFF